MLLWALLSLAAAALWAIVSIIDKYMVDKLTRNPNVPLIFWVSFGLLASAAICVFQGLPPLSYANICLAMAAGIFMVLGGLFYFQAAKIEEISRVVPMNYLIPLFLVVLAAVFLGEIFAPLTYFGIALLVAGAVLISMKKAEFRIGKAFALMILSSLALSVAAIISKYLLGFVDFWAMFSYVRIGTIIPLIPLVYLNYRDILLVFKEHGAKAFAIMSSAEILDSSASLIFAFAVSIGFVTLANALVSLQSFFVFLITIALSLFWPNVLKEEIGNSTLILKFVAMALMFVGALLVT
jgi:drug/metabolite transporter (DMT)-like permease